MPLITEEYAEQYRRMYETAQYGIQGWRWANEAHAFLDSVGAASVLDYGAGQGTLSAALRDLGYRVTEYEPGIPEKAEIPEGPFDAVVTTDVLEHVEPECIDDVLDYLHRVARYGMFAVIATRTAVLLDAEHFDGASTDAVATPTSTVPDSCALRLVLPQLGEPWMDMLECGRLHARRPELVRYPDGERGFRFEIDMGGGEGGELIVFTDAALNPTSVDITDALLVQIRSSWPDSLQTTGPADPSWRQAWAGHALRFESGHWPRRDGDADRATSGAGS